MFKALLIITMFGVGGDAVDVEIKEVTSMQFCNAAKIQIDSEKPPTFYRRNVQCVELKP